MLDSHMHFPPIHPNTKLLTGLSVDLPSEESVKKFRGGSFLTKIPARLNMSKRTLPSRSCGYLPLWSYNVLEPSEIYVSYRSFDGDSDWHEYNRRFECSIR